jgi:hypothetical protein
VEPGEKFSMFSFQLLVRGRNHKAGTLVLNRKDQSGSKDFDSERFAYFFEKVMNLSPDQIQARSGMVESAKNEEGRGQKLEVGSGEKLGGLRTP